LPGFSGREAVAPLNSIAPVVSVAIYPLIRVSSSSGVLTESAFHSPFSNL
jgi:hypothetical protein